MRTSNVVRARKGSQVTRLPSIQKSLYSNSSKDDIHKTRISGYTDTERQNLLHCHINDVEWNDESKKLHLLKTTMVGTAHKLALQQISDNIDGSETVEEMIKSFVAYYCDEHARRNFINYLASQDKIMKTRALTVRTLDGQLVEATALLKWLPGNDPPDPTPINFKVNVLLCNASQMAQ